MRSEADICLYFSSIQNAMEVTGTFKQMKAKLVEESFDPARVQDPLYILDDHQRSYIPMTAQLYSSIISGNLKLWAALSVFIGHVNSSQLAVILNGFIKNSWWESEEQDSIQVWGWSAAWC